MMGWATAILAFIGGAFMLLAAVGIIRLPDLFTRMQAATKSSTLGVCCMLLAAFAHFGTLDVGIWALAVIVFFFLTAPVAAHMIARAAYLVGVELWEGTVLDDLRGRYDRRARRLHGTDRTEVAGVEPETWPDEEPVGAGRPRGFGGRN